MGDKTKTREREASIEAPPMMTHWVDELRPTHFLCGKQVTEYLGHTDGDVDCVVCMGLDKVYPLS